MDELIRQLRQVAQKRKQGMLRAATGDKHYEISVMNGKILRAFCLEEPPVPYVLSRLVAGGFIAAGAVDEKETESIEALAQRIEALGIDDADAVFQRALETYQLDMLFDLSRHKEPFFDFRVQGVSVPEYVSLSLPAAQFLLELAELESDNERFSALFGELGDENVVIERNIEGERSEPAETVIWELLDAPRPLPELQAKSLLQAMRFKRALLSLFDRGMVRVAVPQEEPEPAEDVAAKAAQAAPPPRTERLLESQDANSKLLEERTLRSITLGIRVLFLLVLMAVLPVSIHRWFGVLSEFSSQSVNRHDTLNM